MPQNRIDVEAQIGSDFFYSYNQTVDLGWWKHEFTALISDYLTDVFSKEEFYVLSIPCVQVICLDTGKDW